MNPLIGLFISILLAAAVHSNVIMALVASVILFYIFYSSWIETSVIAPSIAQRYGIQSGLIANLPFWITFALLQVPGIHNFAHTYANFFFPRH